MSVVNQSNATIGVPANTVETVNGDDDIINADDNVTLTVNGFNDTINQSNGLVTLGGTAAEPDVINGSHLEITVLANSFLDLNGSISDVHLGANSQVIAIGDNTNFFGSDDRIVTSQANVGGDAVTGNNNRLVVGVSSQLTLDGNSNFVHARDHASMAMTGSDERLVGADFAVLASSGSDLFLGRNGQTGAADTLTASNVTARTGANSNIILSGDDDTVAVREDTNLYFVGDGLSTHVGQGSDVTINGPSSTSVLDTLTGAHFTVTVATASNVELSTLGVTATLVDNVALAVARSDNSIHAGGSDTISILSGAASNQVLLGQNDVITDSGWNSTFEAAANVGAATLKNFGADPAGIVDLLNGVGGYATAQDAAAALTSDGASGSMLSLGVNGSIDFAGSTNLTAANFKIG
jgi:hypothetical protein